MREQAVGRGAVPVQRVGRELAVSPGFSTCGCSPLKQMRPTPERQNRVCPTGCECQAVRAPGVKVTTEPPSRDGGWAVITGSWNTTPVNVSAAPRRVVRSPARMTPALTGIICAPSPARDRLLAVSIAVLAGDAQSGRP